MNVFQIESVGESACMEETYLDHRVFILYLSGYGLQHGALAFLFILAHHLSGWHLGWASWPETSIQVYPSTHSLAPEWPARVSLPITPSHENPWPVRGNVQAISTLTVLLFLMACTSTCSPLDRLATRPSLPSDSPHCLQLPDLASQTVLLVF